MKALSAEFLMRRKAVITEDLLAKVEAEDYHGVADCAMDLREIQAQLTLLHLQTTARLLQAEGDA